MDPVEQLRFLVLAAQRDGNRALAALLRPLDVTPAQAEVLRVIARAGTPITVRQLGERLVCEPGSPSRLVSSLVDAGLIERGAHPEDARASALSLSARGRRVAEQVAEVEARFHADLAAQVGSRRDIDAALRVLQRLSGDGASATALRRRLSD